MGRRIAVVGGGAAGMAAAIQAARAGAEVTIYERNDRVGRKILSTGNGKCNFSNEKMSADCYRGSGAALVDRLYERYGTAEVKAFFQELGMRIKDRNGYLYPASEQASTVLDVLRYELERLAVDIHTGLLVTGLAGTENGLSVMTADRRRKVYDAVLLAGGGRAAPKTGSDGTALMLAKRLGHKIVPTVPALTALRCEEDFFRRVAGVRCEAKLTLLVNKKSAGVERGELQWTDYGISGIPVFQLSREAAYALRAGKDVRVVIDLLPDFAGDTGAPAYRTFWAERWRRQGGQTMEQFMTGVVNKKLGLLLLHLAEIRESERAQDVSAPRRERLAVLGRSLAVTVRETNSFDQAQACAGGIDCGEVTDELESVLVPGLFFAGEILDIDGLCGGYNLQWAWSSGMAAGLAAAHKA